MMLYIFVLIIVVWVYYIYLAHPGYKIRAYDDLVGAYKTGDMILFHGLDNINPIFIGSYFGHVGIVYVNPDDPSRVPYIFEAFWPDAMPCYKGKNSIKLTPLATRLNTYRGFCFYKPLALPLNDTVIRDFTDFVCYALGNMEYDAGVFINAIDKIIFGQPLTTKTNCGELVYLSLIKLGLLPFDEFNNNRRHHLLYVANLKNCVNNYYLEPVYVYANYFADN